MDFQFTGDPVPPPTASSYWVVADRLLAGAYPGSPNPTDHEAQIHRLVDCGIRRFVNLMEPEEVDHRGRAFTPYADVAERREATVRMSRYAIRDLSIPTVEEMTRILEAIDESTSAAAPVYVHCWGGVGRTGTVVGCWLLRHGLARPENVFDVLTTLRQKDQQRGHLASPETAEQREFVKRWPVGDNPLRTGGAEQ